MGSKYFGESLFIVTPARLFYTARLLILTGNSWRHINYIRLFGTACLFDSDEYMHNMYAKLD